MAATGWLEVRLALVGGLRLARGDRRGLDFFDRSPEGFWRSFRAGMLAYPFYLLLLTMRVTEAEWNEAGAFRIVAVETIAYVISWVAFPLIVLPLSRWLGREHRFFDFMVPYNCCQLLETALFVIIGLEGQSGLLPPAGSGFIEFIAAIAVLLYEWYIARVALDTSGAAATVIVLINLVLGLLVSRAADGLY